MIHSFIYTVRQRTFRALGCCLFLLLIATFDLVAYPSTRVAEFPFSECRELDRSSVLDNLNIITQFIFESDSSAVSAEVERALVRAWIDFQGDQVIDEAVHAAKNRVISEENVWTRFASGWKKEHATELLTRVANYAFQSHAVRELVSTIVVDAAAGIEKLLETSTVRSASASLLCLQQIADREFPSALAEEFENFIRSEGDTYEPSDALDAQSVSFADLAVIHKSAIVGAALIVSSQIAKRLALQGGARLIVTAVLPVIGWSLLVVDIVMTRNGALPKIEEILTSDKMKQEIREHLGNELVQQLKRESPKIARAVAEASYLQYVDFLDDWKVVLHWSRMNPYFRRMIDLIRIQDLPRVTKLVSTLESVVSEEEISQMIENGQLELLLTIPEPSLEILKNTSDVAVVVAWFDLAGERGLVVQVVESGIYRIAMPQQIESRGQLKKILSLDLDHRDLRRIMLLSPELREFLMELPRLDSKEIVAVTRNNDDLSWLLSFLSNMERDRVKVIVNRIITYPELLEELRSNVVQRALKKSSSIADDLDRLLDNKDNSITNRIVRAVENTDGAISPRVVLDLTLSNYERQIIYVMVFLALVILWIIVKGRRRVKR